MLNTPIDNLPFTSILTIRKLRSLGIKTYFDLINYFPFRYDDFTTISNLSSVQEGEIVTVKGQIQSIKNQFVRSRFNIQKVEIFDGTDKIDLIWFNQYYLNRLLKQGAYLSVSGEIKLRGKKRQIVRTNWKKEKTGYKLEIKKYEDQVKLFIKTLPFKLTNAQNISINEILLDL